MILVYGCGWVAGVAFVCVVVFFLSLCFGYCATGLVNSVVTRRCSLPFLVVLVVNLLVTVVLVFGL